MPLSFPVLRNVFYSVQGVWRDPSVHQLRTLRGIDKEPNANARCQAAFAGLASMGITRQSTTLPKATANPIRLQERDYWILEALTKMRFMTTSQLSRLYFESSRCATNKCMRRLLDA